MLNCSSNHQLAAIDTQFHIFATSKFSIDLCCAPGCWSKTAIQLMPEFGKLIGVDIDPTSFEHKNAQFLISDVTSNHCFVSLRKQLNGALVDVVLHDGSNSDTYSQNMLVLSAMQLASKFLRIGGAFVTTVQANLQYFWNIVQVMEVLYDKVSVVHWVNDEMKPFDQDNQESRSELGTQSVHCVCQGLKQSYSDDQSHLYSAENVLTDQVHEFLKTQHVLQSSIVINDLNFADLIRNNTIYVDKTQILYNLITDKTNRRFMIARPRRFGKSLTCATLKSIFEGQKELFNDLWIGQSSYDFKKYKVIYMDFLGITGETAQEFKQSIKYQLRLIAKNFQVSLDSDAFTIAQLVVDLFKQLAGSVKKSVVLIIDEYDKPILSCLPNVDQMKGITEVLSEFYSALKLITVDTYLRFLFMTGVTTFCKASIFSGANNVPDYTWEASTATIMGFTQNELFSFFSSSIYEFAAKNKISVQQTKLQLKKHYNGYSFINNSTLVQTVYNPYSIANCFIHNKIDNFWIKTGQPSFLSEFINKNHNFFANLSDFFCEIQENFDTVINVEDYYSSYKIILLQSGYLTIQQENGKLYYKFPNDEVREAMLNMIVFSSYKVYDQLYNNSYFKNFHSALNDDNIDSFCKVLEDCICKIPYPLIKMEQEIHYQLVFFLIISIFQVRRPPHAELCTNRGRIDIVLDGVKNIYIIELKRNRTPYIAIDQIMAKQYYKQFENDRKVVVVVGINFFQLGENQVQIQLKHKLLSEKLQTPYCFKERCQCDKTDPMVQCKLQANCQYADGGWFHLFCLGFMSSFGDSLVNVDFYCPGCWMESGHTIVDWGINFKISKTKIATIRKQLILLWLQKFGVNLE